MGVHVFPILNPPPTSLPFSTALCLGRAKNIKARDTFLPDFRKTCQHAQNGLGACEGRLITEGGAASGRVAFDLDF